MVKQHKEVVSTREKQNTPSNIAEVTSHQAPRFSPNTNKPFVTEVRKTTPSSDDTLSHPLRTFIANDDDDNVKTMDTVVDGEQLTDLQRDAVTNLRLITQLVQQVHQLGLRADRVLTSTDQRPVSRSRGHPQSIRDQLRPRVGKYEDQSDNEIDDADYYQYDAKE